MVSPGPNGPRTPRPRRAAEPAAPAGSARPPVPRPRPPLPDGAGAYDAWRAWYAEGVGWPVTGGAPPLLPTGVAFDALSLPARAGWEVLDRLHPSTPVAVDGETMRLLVAPGSAGELPGLLDWLEWGGLVPELRGVGEGGHLVAPAPPGREEAGAAARWLRSPVAGRPGRTPVLPGLTRLGDGGAPDLVRLVSAAATACHRLRLGRSGDQPLAFSYSARMLAGTRPRSLMS
ncbi:SCO3374 family protein [Streptomyces sp. NPDC058374]|uniref:SCO3374 family protein n=1 Tax=unclassified Streptomyces TaxID=2593676 RepID=UPI0036471970